MKIKEETQPVPVNNVGSGSVEGIGIGPKGEPGVKRKKLRQLFPLIRRNTPIDAKAK